MIVSLENLSNVIHIDRKTTNRQQIDKSIPFSGWFFYRSGKLGCSFLLIYYFNIFRDRIDGIEVNFSYFSITDELFPDINGNLLLISTE